MGSSLASEKNSSAILEKKLRELQSKLDNLVQIEMVGLTQARRGPHD